MTHANNPESGIDVETIIRQIQDDVSASELPADPAIAESAALDNDLNAILEPDRYSDGQRQRGPGTVR